MTEAQLQQMVIDLARWAGFMHFHDNDPRRNRAGFPDLVLIHTTTGRLIFIELKSEKGKLRPEQDVWLTHLGVHHECYVWRPQHWETGLIRRVLLEERRAVARFCCRCEIHQATNHKPICPVCLDDIRREEKER